jgi:uncharacterized protein YdaU (DUF1376 family)
MGEHLPWMKFYPRETLADGHFSGWSLEERGAWVTLILHNWTEGSLPSDLPALARLLHVDHQLIRGLWSAVGNRFIPHPDMPGRITSPRLEKEREAAQMLIKKRGEAGKKGASSRWDREKKRHGKRMANAYQPHASANATAMAKHSDPDPDPADQIQIQEQDERQPANTPPPGWLAEIAGEIGTALGRTSLGLGKDPERTLREFMRWRTAVGDPDLVAECVRLAKERGVVPSHLSWFVGWLETVPDGRLHRRASE